jgi:type II secretory pathway component PulL
MVSFIVLPPLHQQPLGADTPVTVMHAGQTLLSPLQTALTQFAKALVALHPVDAPLHAVTLPPLPANRRDAALRVKLEDQLLGDTAQLSLAVTPLAKHRFDVSCVATSLLAAVTAQLSALGHGQRTVVCLASSLPNPSEHRLGDWTLWRDPQGAGAVPTAASSTASPLNASALSAYSAAFTAAQTKGAAWQRWRWAALLAVLCALVYTVGTAWHSRQLLALEQQANRATAAAFQDALPNTPMVDAVVQLQRAATGNNALSSALGKLPADWPQGTVTQINWANKRLSVTANPGQLKLAEAQQKALTDSLAASNITLNWSKP